MKGDNFLKKGQQNLIRQGLGTWAPYIETDNEWFSRKIEGQIVPGREENAYDKVNIFVQKGLGSHQNIFDQLLRIVCGFQYGAERGIYSTFVFSFGWEDQRLHREGRFTINSMPKIGNFAKFISEVSGKEPPNNSIIPNFAGSRSEDLNIFLCHDHEVKISEEARELYMRGLKRRSLWLFFGGDKVKWEFGTYVPYLRWKF